MSARRTFARSLAVPAAVIGFSALAAAPALAHVTITPDEGAAGEYTVGTFSVGHGCEGSPTTSVTIKIPAELNSVTPTLNPNWVVKKNIVALDQPVKDAHGNEITERVDTVVYSAKTPLEDGFRDTFALSFQVPDAAGKTLAFPTLQKCVKGQTDWVEVAAEGAEEPEHPAPAFAVLEGTGDGHGSSGTVDEAASESHGDEETEGASKGLAYTGLGVGVLGFLTAAAALAKGRKDA